MQIKVWHFQFKFESKWGFKSSVQWKVSVRFSPRNNNPISSQFSSKIIPDTPTALAASHHMQKISSLMRWRRWEWRSGSSPPSWIPSVHVHARTVQTSPRSVRASNRAKNLTCVTGHKHNKSLSNPQITQTIISQSLSCNVTATVLFHLKMAAERSLNSQLRRPHNYCTYLSFTQRTYTFTTFTVLIKHKILTG